MDNIFGRVNTTLPEEQWRSIQEDILEDGLESVIRGHLDVYNLQDGMPYKPEDDPQLELLMRNAAKALVELENYLECSKFDEDHPTYQEEKNKYES